MLMIVKKKKSSNLVNNENSHVLELVEVVYCD